MVLRGGADRANGCRQARGNALAARARTSPARLRCLPKALIVSAPSDASRLSTSSPSCENTSWVNHWSPDSGRVVVFPASTTSVTLSTHRHVRSGVRVPELIQKCRPVPLILNMGSPCTTGPGPTRVQPAGHSSCRATNLSAGSVSALGRMRGGVGTCPNQGECAIEAADSIAGSMLGLRTPRRP
eukprot:scaffold52790_cov63-Phaeocystis_antarctica.AAC.1